MATIHVKIQRPADEVECDHLTAGAFCAPCVAEAQQAATRALTESQMDPGLKALANSGDNTGEDGDEIDQAQPEDVPEVVRFSGPIGFENQMTGDGRFIAPGALRAEMPIPLRYVPQDTGGHDGAYVVGLFETMTTADDGAINAEGFIDTTTPQGMEVYQGMQKGTIGGISMDLDDMDYEVYARNELLQEAPEAADVAADAAAGPFEGYTKVAGGESDDVVFHINSARVRGATLVQIPAFAGAKISLVASGTYLETSEELFDAALEDGLVVEAGVREDGVVLYDLTAAAPVNPPAAWFDSPGFTEPTPLTFTKDGRVYGHIAIWGTCHTGFPGACVQPPRSQANYAYFRTGILQTAEGTEVPVGHLTMETGHAGPNMSAAATMAHYDNTGLVAADVAAGDDDFGIWVSGALRPDLSDEEIRDLRSAPMSGDWRRIGGNLELMAVLAVNLPGFPVLRTKALVASGATQSLFVPIDSNKVEMAPTSVKIEISEEISGRFSALETQMSRIRRAQLALMMEKE
jgi:phage head maturation protease